MTPHPLLVRFGVVPLAIGAALLLRLALWPVVGAEPPFLFLWPAVFVAAWYGGFWPGVLATILATLAESYLAFEPAFSFVVAESAEVVAIIWFLVLGLVVSGLVEQLHQARWRAERYAQESHHQSELLAEADRRKDEALAVLAHEMRNTLAPVRNVLPVLRAAGTSAERALDLLERQTGQMVRLVEDIPSTLVSDW